MKTLVIVLILAVIAVGGFVMFGREARSPEAAVTDMPVVSDARAMQGTQDANTATADTENVPSVSSVSVIYTNAGYVPARVEITAGETVTFVNNNAADSWPATNIHPTHLLYPGSDIKKCFDGSPVNGLFDSCRGLKTGETWSFIFTEKGEWHYHDHLHPNDTGVVVVK